MTYTDGTYRVTADGTLERVELTEGFMVGVRSLSGPHDATPLTLVGRWTDQHCTIRYPDGSFKDGVVYWDEVECHPVLSEALALAEMYGELAIWDNANGKEIRV